MARVVLHQRLGAVAVVHVPVDDQHPLPARPLRVPRRDDGVVSQAEAHRRATRARGGPGGRTAAKAWPRAVERVVHGGEHGARRAERGLPARAVEHGVEEERAAPARAHRLEAVEVRPGCTASSASSEPAGAVRHVDAGVAPAPARAAPGAGREFRDDRGRDRGGGSRGG